MLNFRNDYCSFASSEVLKKICELSKGVYVGYSEDEITLEARKKIRSFIKSDDAGVYFLPGGTITNKVMIAHALKPYEAVIAVSTSHINVHETGAIEETGHKILLCPSHEGKISIANILDVVNAHTDKHMVHPKMVYISNPTEYGTIYTKEELMKLYKFCQDHKLYLYVDGARLFNALMSKSNDIDIEDYTQYSDAFYIGGTKSGGLMGEALVINNKDLEDNIEYSIKHFGGMISKGFILSSTFLSLLENNLGENIAERENKFAEEIQNELIKLDYPLYLKSTTNQIFFIMEMKKAKEFLKKVDAEVFLTINKNYVIRLVTSYMTTKEDVEELKLVLKEMK